MAAFCGTYQEPQPPRHEKESECSKHDGVFGTVFDDVLDRRPPLQEINNRSLHRGEAAESCLGLETASANPAWHQPKKIINNPELRERRLRPSVSDPTSSAGDVVYEDASEGQVYVKYVKNTFLHVDRLAEVPCPAPTSKSCGASPEPARKYKGDATEEDFARQDEQDLAVEKSLSVGQLSTVSRVQNDETLEVEWESREITNMTKMRAQPVQDVCLASPERCLFLATPERCFIPNDVRSSALPQNLASACLPVKNTFIDIDEMDITPLPKTLSKSCGATPERTDHIAAQARRLDYGVLDNCGSNRSIRNGNQVVTLCLSEAVGACSDVPALPAVENPLEQQSMQRPPVVKISIADALLEEEREFNFGFSADGIVPDGVGDVELVGAMHCTDWQM